MTVVDLGPATTLQVSDLVLARVGGLPVEAVPGPSARTEDLLRRLDRTEAELAAGKDAVVDRLFAAVPLVEDKGARRALLAAKRRVFALRTTGIQPAHLPLIDRDCEPSLGRLSPLLISWDERASELSRLNADLEDSLAADDRLLADALVATLDHASYARSLAIATPELVEHQVGKAGPVVPSDRLLRSLFLYGTRATRKTSPFSGLTFVARAGQHGRGRSTAQVATHLAAAVLREGVLAGAAGQRCRVVASPRRAISVENHESIVMLPEMIVGDGVVFCEEKVVGAENLPADVLALSERTAASTTLDEAAAHLGGPRPGTRLRRMLETGVVRPVTPWARGASPVDGLVDTFPDGAGRVRRSELDALRTLPGDLTGAGPKERVSLLRVAQGVAEKVFDRGQLAGRSGGLLYEDCEYDGDVPDPLASAAVREDLGLLAERVRPWLFRSHLYDLLVHRFVARFGSGGECREPLGWLMSLAVDNDGDLEPLRAIQRDRALDDAGRAVRAALPGGASAPFPHIAAFLQVAAPDLQDVCEGRGLTVVNAMGSGVGALLARFHGLLGEDYRDAVASVTRSLWRTERVLEFQAWTSANTAQAACAGVLPELGLPGEPGSGRGVWIDDLTIVHDSSTDTLQFRDRHGPVGIAYLGLNPQHLLNSYYRWLAVIADPWFRFPPLGDQAAYLKAAAATEAPTEVVHEARQQTGRLVLQRECWSVPVAEIQRLAAGGDGGAVRRWSRFRQAHGIPAEVFAHQIALGAAQKGDARKPIYVNLGSTLSLHTMHKWLNPSCAWVRLVEALPDARQHWLRDAQGQSRVSEFLATMRWRDCATGEES